MLDRAQDDELVMNLVQTALAVPPEEREAFVQNACPGNSELFSQVWEYVESEQRMNGFLLEPLCPQILFEHPFEPGDLLEGRFLIVREVAQGGMGIVYEAVDQKLERRIALKCAKTGFRKRLPPEVRNASDISHPNVCKIFEIHTASTGDGDIDFLTMEFLQGETLAERLRDGPLPQKEARSIALQLCAGLAAAHRNHVIHGDLKSNNIILSTAGDGTIRAVITDFGLACTLQTSKRTAQSGQAAGTPDYMAPELWRGEKASVASDIYALGVILHELACGDRPQAHRGERLARKLPAVHRKWDHILQRCLDPDPGRRFLRADDISQALAPPRSRRWLLGTTAAAVLAVLVTYVVTNHAATSPQESVRLAFLPLASRGDTASLAQGLSRDTANQLARLRGSAHTKFALIPAADALRGKVDTSEKARAVLGATHVLHGTLEKENEKLILHVYLTAARTQANTREWRAAYGAGEARYVPVALAGLVTGTFRLPLLAPAVTVNTAARQDYLSGLSYVRRDTGVDSAIVCMERAVSADPDSPLTYAGLAEAEWFKYYLTKDHAFLERAAQSVRQAERRNPDLPQVRRIAGLLRANSGLYEQATAEYRRAIELDPANGDAYRRLGLVYEQNNQLDEALAAYRRAIEAEPEYYRNHQALGAFYNQRANYREAIKQFVRTVELAPEEPNAHFALAAAYVNLGQFLEAEKELRVALRLGETPVALHTLGLVLMYQGRDLEAIPYMTQALNRSPERSLWWMLLATSYRRKNLITEAERANRRGLYLAEKEMTHDPRNGTIRSHLAYLCASLGNRSRAESEISQALQLSPNDAATRWWAALTYEALGQRDATIAVLSVSPSEQLADLARWPDLADLHKDSRFKQLIADHQK
jgi:tetratricopeptide (TPR) repeat protein